MIISCISYKGGVGKTTISQNIAVCLAHMKQKVCIVDADESANTADWIEGRKEKLPTIVVESLNEGESLAKKIQRLYQEYDYIIIDSPPSQATIADMILMLSHLVLVPILPKGKQETNTINQLMGKIEDLEIAKKMTIPVRFVVNEYNPRITLHKNFVETMRELYPNKVFNSCLHNRVAYPNVTHIGEGVYEYDDPKAREEMVQLTNELLEILQTL